MTAGTGARTTTLVVLLLLAACQTRHQAKIVTVAAGGVALAGGYFEYEARATPYNAITAGSVAVLSAISIFFLDEHPRMLFHHRSRGWEPDDRNARSELLAGIHRTGCYGTCPAYHVAIYRDGEVRYVGEGDVVTTGTAIGHLSPDEVSALERQLVEAKVSSLAGAYLDRDCTDLPTVYLWYRPSGGSTSFVAHYLGDRHAPPQLAGVEQAVDMAVDVDHWIGPRKGHLGAVASYCR